MRTAKNNPCSVSYLKNLLKLLTQEVFSEMDV